MKNKPYLNQVVLVGQIITKKKQSGKLIAVEIRSSCMYKYYYNAYQKYWIPITDWSDNVGEKSGLGILLCPQSYFINPETKRRNVVPNHMLREVLVIGDEIRVEGILRSSSPESIDNLNSYFVPLKIILDNSSAWEYYKNF